MNRKQNTITHQYTTNYHYMLASPRTGTNRCQTFHFWNVIFVKCEAPLCLGVLNRRCKGIGWYTMCRSIETKPRTSQLNLSEKKTGCCQILHSVYCFVTQAWLKFNDEHCASSKQYSWSRFYCYSNKTPITKNVTSSVRSVTATLHVQSVMKVMAIFPSQSSVIPKFTSKGSLTAVCTQHVSTGVLREGPCNV